MKSLSASHLKQSIGAAFLFAGESWQSRGLCFCYVLLSMRLCLLSTTIQFPCQSYYQIILLASRVTHATQLGGWQLQAFKLVSRLPFRHPALLPFTWATLSMEKFGVSLTPAVTVGGELFANIANRISILSTTNAGLSTFEASIGMTTTCYLVDDAW